MKNNIFNKISPSEALEILKQIAKTDKKLKKRIIEIAEDLFRNVDVEVVCDDVFNALDAIDFYELWDRAGPKTDGYTSPEDMAVEMFEEALEPFLQELYGLFDFDTIAACHAKRAYMFLGPCRRCQRRNKKGIM